MLIEECDRPCWLFALEGGGWLGEPLGGEKILEFLDPAPAIEGPSFSWVSLV